MTSRPPVFRIRFSLKIIGGFFVIVLVMLLGGVYAYIQLTSLSSQELEFRIIPLVDDIDRFVESERDLSAKFFDSRDTYLEATFDVVTGKVNMSVDSLAVMVGREEAAEKVVEVRTIHQRYISFIHGQMTLVKQNPSYNPAPVLGERKALVDSLIGAIQQIRTAYIPTLSRSLRILDQKIAGSVTGVKYSIYLTALIAVILGLLMAKSFTKPITALTSGTQKVAEGEYATVPVTTTDEFADLTVAFNTMGEKLRRLDEMRSQLMSEISHEMRTPLQVIKAGCYSIVHMKGGTPLAPSQREAVGMIHNATNRINQFINLFLDVAKMEAGLMKFNFTRQDLVELITPLVQEGQLIGQSRNIRVSLRSDPVPPMMIDADRITQVFSNLISNALKYTPEHGSIDIAVTHHATCDLPRGRAGCVQIDVTDTGVGIPREDVDKVFNKFYQAKNTPLVSEKGSGLGLALVKHVAEAHGGRATVTSEVGVGSTFTVLLPLEGEAA
ncbi:MAG TPA: HAMP domain-containing sensor histidine kinase [Bacteroidota bacterium]|nr:HAMP domain-containing sensor histidine kinase [Bacteroidota bacterium]